MGINTRKERFAKYRQEIRNTPDDKFSNGVSKLVFSADTKSLENANHPSVALSYGESLKSLTDIAASKTNDGESPYQRYLGKKRSIFLIKLLIFILAVAGMVIWYLLLQQRASL